MAWQQMLGDYLTPMCQQQVPRTTRDDKQQLQWWWCMLLVLPAFDLLSDLMFTQLTVLSGLNLVVDSDEFLLDCIFA